MLKRLFYVLFILIFVIIAFTFSIFAQNDNNEIDEDVPEYFKPFSGEYSMMYDHPYWKVIIPDERKQKVQDWVEDNSWEKAKNLAYKAHSRTEKTKYGFMQVLIHTPIYAWIEHNWFGEERFWDKEKIENKFSKSVIPPSRGMYFIVRISTDKLSKKVSKKYADEEAQKIANNLRFGLEDAEGNRWETSGEVKEIKESSDGINTYNLYREISVQFEFEEYYQMDVSEIVFHAIRTDIVKKRSFKWTIN